MTPVLQRKWGKRVDPGEVCVDPSLSPRVWEPLAVDCYPSKEVARDKAEEELSMGGGGLCADPTNGLGSSGLEEDKTDFDAGLTLNR